MNYDELTKEQIDEWCIENGYRLVELSDKLDKEEIIEEGIDGILKRISKHSMLSVDEINQNTRKRGIVEARQIAQHIAHRHIQTSLATIGYKIGRKDHATVLHSTKTVVNLIDTDSFYRRKWDKIIKMYDLD